MNTHPSEQKTTIPFSRKAISYTLAAAMLHASVAPAIASTAAQKQQEQIQATQNTDDAVTQMIELAAKHELNVEFIKEVEAKKREGRNIFKRMVDGVIELFTDNSEEVALDEANDSTATKLLALEAKAATEHAELITELEQQKSDLKAKGFDAKSLQEQDDLIAEMNKRYEVLNKLLTTLKSSKNDSAKDNALAALNKQLTDWQPKVAHTDMENLPWGTPKNDVRAPVVAKHSDINKVSFKNSHLNTAVGQWRETEYKIGNYLVNKNPIQKANAGSLSGMTATGDWPVLKALPKEVQPADLEANQDVQITESIQQLADELDRSPAKIFAWVHDNIEFVPTYGSIQGSAYTLDTKRGNSADTASLLIALYRAAGIPARYVYGTVDIPAKFAMSWVGGVNNIDAAANLIGQGGIPHTVIMNASEPKYLRMEHVWVEAHVDWIGSRGNLSADKTKNNMKQWIPLDATYKSYTRTEGIDLAKAVPFDAEKLLADAQQGATIDGETGSVQNINQQAINQAIEDYQAKVKTYLEQNKPNATVDDVLGTNKINEWGDDTLAPMLPYEVKTVVSDYYELPAKMRHYFVVQLFADAGIYGRTDYNSPVMNTKIATTRLQGKPFSLSFKAANENEEEKLLNLLPNDENGRLPTKLPTNIKMLPELTLGDELVGTTSNTYNLGYEVQMRLGYESPNSTFGLTKNTINAGEYHAIGYNLQGISKKQLDVLNQRLSSVDSKLKTPENVKEDQDLKNLSRHDLSGLILQSGVQNYFSLNDFQDKVAQKNANIVQYPYLMYGTFSNTLSTSYRYGIPFNTSPVGFTLDIDRILHTTIDKNNNRQNQIAYNLARGSMYSANEHLVPEQLFDNENTQEKDVDGISAVKALQLAEVEGQSIYKINNQNRETIIPKLNHSSFVMNEINNALSAGKEVTISEKQVTLNDWKGAGYLVLEPDTGAGGYFIEGGDKGGFSGWEHFKEKMGVAFTFYSYFSKFFAALADRKNIPLPKALPFINFLDLTRFTHSVLVNMDCARSAEAIILVTVTTIIQMLLLVLLATTLGPLGLFMAGAIIDATFSRLNSLATNHLCRG